MKNLLNTEVKLKDPATLKHLLELLASEHEDRGYHAIQISEEWLPLEVCCTEAHVMGDILIPINSHNEPDLQKVPFVSNFLFTCIKDKYGLFNLEWSFSMC